MADVPITSVVNTPSDQIATKAFVASTYATIAEPIAVAGDSAHLLAFDHTKINKWFS